MIIKIILDILVMLTSLPAGYFLAWLCKDELVDGRKWFRIIFACLFSILVFILIFYRNLNTILTLVYMILVVLLALLKGRDKKFLEN